MGEDYSTIDGDGGQSPRWLKTALGLRIGAALTHELSNAIDRACDSILGKEWHRHLFLLARGWKMAGLSFDRAKRLFPAVFDEFMAQELCCYCDDVQAFAEFCRAWERVKGDNPEEIKRRISARLRAVAGGPMPDWIRELARDHFRGNVNIQKVVACCYAMHCEAEGGTWFLPTRELAQILRLRSHSDAGLYLSALKDKGVIKVEQQANKIARRATRYRWVGIPSQAEKVWDF